MTRREDMIAGGFELAGWGLVGLCMAIFYVGAAVFWFIGLVLYWLGVIR